MSIAFNEKNDDLSIKSRKITVLRRKLKLSYAKFGMPCGYVGGYISCVERGEVNVSDEFCEKVCMAYGVKKDWLLDDEISVEPILYEHGGSRKEGADSASQTWPSGNGSSSGDSLSTPGDRLRSVFESSGLSQREFCGKLGASTSMLGSLMDGRRQITQRYAEKVEKVFHVGADWLLYGREECRENPCGDEMIAFLKSSPEARKVVTDLMKKAQK